MTNFPGDRAAPGCALRGPRGCSPASPAKQTPPLVTERGRNRLQHATGHSRLQNRMFLLSLEHLKI